MAASGTSALGLGVATLWLSIVVLIPLAALVARSTDGGLDTFWSAISSRQADEAFSHFARDMGENAVLIGQFDMEHGASQNGDYFSFDLNNIGLYGHV